MNSYPQKNSVLVINNALIHHNEKLIKIIKSIDYKVIFLYPYSSDYNSIELAFSVIKSWLKKNKDFIEYYLDLYFALLLVSSSSFRLRNTFFKTISISRIRRASGFNLLIFLSWLKVIGIIHNDLGIIYSLLYKSNLGFKEAFKKRYESN